MSLERQFADAGLNLLRADTDLTVYPDAEGFVPAQVDPPYVRAYTSTGWPKEGDANALDGQSVTATARWYINCVGATEPACQELAGRVRTQLLNASPAVAGRSNGLIYFESDSGEQPQRTELGGSPLYVLTVVYAMLSAPG